MVCRASSRVETRYHHNLRVSRSDKRVSENHSQLRRSEWNVVAVTIESSDTLFEGQQTLIDFCSLEPPLSIVALTVSCPLRTGQIYQQKFSVLLPVDFNRNLTDGVTSARGVICLSLMRSSDRMAVIYDLLYV